MKTERRHELQHNYLADWLGTQGEQLKPYGKAIVGGFLLTAAILFAFSAMRANQNKRNTRGWNEYFEAASESDILGLREMSAKYRGIEPGAWALQSAGDLGLASGSQAMFNDRAEAKGFLTGAVEDYEAAYNMAKTDMLRQRALMGLAQAHEALNQFYDAEVTYNKVISGWPQAPLAETAKERVAFLKKPSTLEFYDWFYKQQPVPRSPLGDPVGGEGIQPPSAYGDLPSDPSLQLPNESELGGSSLMPPDAGLEKTEVVPAEISDDSDLESAPSTDAPPTTETDDS